MAATDVASINVDCSGPGGFPLISRTKINMLALTAGNFTAQAGLLASLEGAYNNLTDGIVKSTDVTVSVPYSGAYPGVTANRGQKWIITTANPTGRKYTYTIPAGPGSGELQSDNISADLAGTTWAAFVAAFEAAAVDPFGGALTVVSAKLGGRRR
jgi:hypothetical protein